MEAFPQFLRAPEFPIAARAGGFPLAGRTHHRVYFFTRVEGQG
jgi:hypothetical protein